MKLQSIPIITTRGAKRFLSRSHTPKETTRTISSKLLSKATKGSSEITVPEFAHLRIKGKGDQQKTITVAKNASLEAKDVAYTSIYNSGTTKIDRLEGSLINKEGKSEVGRVKHNFTSLGGESKIDEVGITAYIRGGQSHIKHISGDAIIDKGKLHTREINGSIHMGGNSSLESYSVRNNLQMSGGQAKINRITGNADISGGKLEYQYILGQLKKDGGKIDKKA